MTEEEFMLKNVAVIFSGLMAGALTKDWTPSSSHRKMIEEAAVNTAERLYHSVKVRVVKKEVDRLGKILDILQYDNENMTKNGYKITDRNHLLNEIEETKIALRAEENKLVHLLECPTGEY